MLWRVMSLGREKGEQLDALWYVMSGFGSSAAAMPAQSCLQILCVYWLVWSFMLLLLLCTS